MAKGLGIDPRKRNPPCPGRSSDSSGGGGGSPFSPENPNSAAPRSMSNLVRYPLFLAHYLVSAVRAGGEPKASAIS
jgi:hypothetical protein